MTSLLTFSLTLLLTSYWHVHWHLIDVFIGISIYIFIGISFTSLIGVGIDICYWHVHGHVHGHFCWHSYWHFHWHLIDIFIGIRIHIFAYIYYAKMQTTWKGEQKQICGFHRNRKTSATLVRILVRKRKKQNNLRILRFYCMFAGKWV